MNSQEFTIDELKETLEKHYLNYDEKKLNNLIDFLIKTNKLTYSINTSKYKLLTQIKKQ
ncbi:MAG: hypothetical protein QXY70_02965 [Nanopusillaceae archaeon]